MNALGIQTRSTGKFSRDQREVLTITDAYHHKIH